MDLCSKQLNLNVTFYSKRFQNVKLVSNVTVEYHSKLKLLSNGRTPDTFPL